MMVQSSYRVWGLLLVAAAASAGCSSLLGDFATGGGSDASVSPDSPVGSSGGSTSSSSGGTGAAMAHIEAGPDSTVDHGDSGMPDAGDAGVEETSTGEDARTQVDAAPCTTGSACSPATCSTGITICSDGGALCVPTGLSYSGTPCGDGGVCNNGNCIPCSVGSSCADAGSCQMATIACSTGSPLCMAGGGGTNGHACGQGLHRQSRAG